MMIRELTEFYSPRNILFRDEPLEEIRNVFRAFKEYGVSKHLIIQGYSGSGKTTIINQVLEEENNGAIYVSGASCVTAHEVLKAITDLTYNTRPRIISEAIRKFRAKPQVIVIDEINKLKRLEEIKWLFNDLNTLYRETGCSIIVLSNRKDILKIIPTDAKSTFYFNRIDLLPYDPIQLKEIMEQRLELIKVNHGINFEIPDDFLPYVCALAVKEDNGSVRFVLNMIREALVSKDFSHDGVNKILKRMKDGEWEQFINDMPSLEKRFLSLLIMIFDGRVEVPLSEIFKQVNSYPPQRVSQLTNVFENDYVIIEKIRDSKDRRGKFIRFISKDVLNKLTKLTEGITPLN